GKYKEAIEDLDLVLQKDQNSLPSLRKAAEIHLLLGNQKEALQMLNRAIQIAPEDPILYRSRADLHQMCGKNEDAISDYTRTTELDPEHAPAFWGRARVHHILGQQKKAEEDWGKAARTDGQYAEMISQGVHLEETQQESSDHPENLLVNQALSCFYRRNFEDALALLDQSLQRNRENGHAWYVRALVRFRLWENSSFLDNSLKNHCLEDLRMALEYRPNLPTAYMLRGRIYEKASQNEEAYADLTRAIELNPQFAPALVYRSQVLIKKEELEAARKDLDNALELNPKYPLAYLRKAETYIHTWRKTGKKTDSPDYENALSNLEKALKANPQFPDALRIRGQIRLEAGEEAKAFDDFSRCRDIHPLDPLL
ncbi:MAG: tetratricopeptide repeat protein, partial [Planctomycetota bacterium]|nr:tetratricopeptide repeat protein [Planctomycetota bacterium]